MSKREQPLKIEIVDGVVSISIGIDTLAHAIEWCPSICRWQNGEYIKPTISDSDAFAASVVYCLHDEEEDGTTPVTDLLDDAAQRCLEDGMDGIDRFDLPEPEGWEANDA